MGYLFLSQIYSVIVVGLRGLMGFSPCSLHVHWHSRSAHVCTLMLMRLYGYSFLSSCCYYKTQFDSKLPDPLALTIFPPPTLCPFHNVPWVFVDVSIETGLYNSEYWLVELVFFQFTQEILSISLSQGDICIRSLLGSLILVLAAVTSPLFMSNKF